MPVSGSYSVSLTRPESTTYTTSGIVTDVSATFVATTILRRVVGKNTIFCSALDRFACNGRISTGPRFVDCSSATHWRISITPGMKTRMAPLSDVDVICLRVAATRL
jgi:hypothetical protein